MPPDFSLRLAAVESGLCEQRGLREVKFELPALIIKCGEKLPAEGYSGNLRLTSSDVEYAVFQRLSGQVAEQVAGTEPYPRRRKSPAPVLVSVAVTSYFSPSNSTSPA